MEEELRFDLQFFAEEVEGEDEGENEGTENPEKQEEPDEPEKKYTDEDVDRLINEKFKKWQEKKNKELEEAEKLAKMTAKEKQDHEMKQLKEELEGLRRANNINEMTKVSREILADKGISISDSLIETLIGDSAEKTKENISQFAESFESAVNKAVDDKLKGKTPKRTLESNSISKKDILSEKDMKKRRRLMAENLELFS